MCAVQLVTLTSGSEEPAHCQCTRLHSSMCPGTRHQGRFRSPCCVRSRISLKGPTLQPIARQVSMEADMGCMGGPFGDTMEGGRALNNFTDSCHQHCSRAHHCCAVHVSNLFNSCGTLVWHTSCGTLVWTRGSHPCQVPPIHSGFPMLNSLPLSYHPCICQCWVQPCCKAPLQGQWG